ncbi:hypothetical protein ACP70R_005474 [Stipagrostis hirtigluma subsp. patula]
MDIEDCASLLLNRVRRLHPWNPEGIVAYILSCKTLSEITKLLASDDSIRPLIVEAMQQFPQFPTPQPPSWGHGSRPFPHLRPQFHPVDSFQGIQAPFPLPHSQLHVHPSGSFPGIRAPFIPIGQIGAFQSPFPEFTGLGEHFQSLSISSDAMSSNQRNASENVTGDPPSSSKAYTRPCHFHFSRGYCKKGESCLFAHASGSYEMHNDRQAGSPGSLHMLEMEIRGLLLSLQPPTVPIESLANMYIGRYGKPLRIERFCMKGQQHAKTGYSLTDLLMCFNTTRLIKREEQHYIVLVEDAPKYLSHGFKLVMPDASSDSNQIYLSFMPQSTFTEEDVRNYFSRYGTVSDVRFPPQARRTFGFVSFLCPGTAKRILSERSPSTPHLICGGHVFIKAYKEKHELDLLYGRERFHRVEKYKLAKEIAHSNSGAHRVSGVNVIHEHHTGEKIPSDHEFRKKLNSGFDLGIVTENCSITVVPETSSPPRTHNLSVRSVSETCPSHGDNTAESSPVSNHLDETSAYQDIDDLKLPESLDIEYQEGASYEQTEQQTVHSIGSEVLRSLISAGSSFS